MANYHDLSEFQLSVLSEIGNIGAGNAATSLASILADKVSMTVPKLQIIDVNSMTTILGGPENELAGILVNMTGDIKGMLLFLLDKEFVCKLINVLLEKNICGFENITDLDMSAIMEIGNIMAGSYVSAMSMLTNLNIGLSAPQLTIDMVGAILSYPAAAFGMMGEKLLFIEENFMSGEEHITSHLLIMPEPSSLQLIMESLEVC